MHEWLGKICHCVAVDQILTVVWAVIIALVETSLYVP